MKKLLFYLATLPIVSSAIAVSGTNINIDIGNDDAGNIIFEVIE